jgi:hypothetical protein
MMPTSNETCVRSDGFSKIKAAVFPASGLYSSPLRSFIQDESEKISSNSSPENDESEMKSRFISLTVNG